MDAPIARLAVLAVALASLGASHRSKNFVVSAPTPQMAEQIGRAAEKYRHDLAIEWLGHEMPNWSQPCPITAEVADHLGAGGATSFVFEHGEVFGWRMTIQGSLTRILDSVLPHEVTHTVFATHFRRPLPRWADEGACTTVEHQSERSKQQTMLIDFLRTGRGIAFSQMFAMKDYPHDVMPLYSQGYSVARYLIAQGGKHKFLEFVADGLRDENWSRAIQQHYGASSLGALQNNWLTWVRKGSPALDAMNETPPLVAVSTPRPSDRRQRPGPKVTLPSPSPDAKPDSSALANADGPSIYELAATSQDAFKTRWAQADKSWHAPRQEETVAMATETDSDERADETGRASSSSAGHQVTRPQPTEQARQIILEWSRPNPSGQRRQSLGMSGGFSTSSLR